MCNLYSFTKGQAAIRELARVMHDTTGNLPPMTGIFPDYAAPVVRNGNDGVRELAMLRWGMPGPGGFRRRTDHKYPQYPKPALACMAHASPSLRGTVHILLRIRRHQTT